MQETGSIQARLQAASTLPDTLAVSFDAFEAIRLAARNCVDRIPELFAAFMTTADAAVKGREALTAAPSLPASGPRSRSYIPRAGRSSRGSRGHQMPSAITGSSTGGQNAGPRINRAAASHANATRRIEDMVRDLQLTEPALLLRAAAIDEAARDLLAEATAKARHQTASRGPVGPSRHLPQKAR